MRELTARQRDVLNFMRAFTARHGVPPTVREIGEKFGVTPRAAFDHLRALERKGMLQRRAGGRTARALTLSDAAGGRAGAGVPILGRIAAGQPLLAEENREGELPIAAGALPGRAEDLFALRVRGDSMINAHICDGDLVLVRRRRAPSSTTSSSRWSRPRRAARLPSSATSATASASSSSPSTRRCGRSSWIRASARCGSSARSSGLLRGF